jgi:hypothetical protein
MRDTAKRARFESLRRGEEEGTLTGAEKAELAQMFEEIESAETVYLRPATERLRAQRTGIAARNEALRGVLNREEALVRRLKQTLLGLLLPCL